MKLNRILSAIMGGSLLLGAAACTDEVEYTPAETITGQGVYLSSELSVIDIPQNATEIVLPIFRTATEGEFKTKIEASIVNSKDETVTGVFTLPSEVTFADGKKEANYVIGVDFAKVEGLMEYSLKLKVVGEGVSTPYGLSENTYVLVYAPWGEFERYGNKDEFAIGTLSAFGIAELEVAAYVSESLVSNQKRFQFGDAYCPELNPDENTWTTYVNGYNFEVIVAGEPVNANNPNLYPVTLTPTPTGDDSSLGSMIYITDVYTYVMDNPSACPPELQPSDFRFESLYDSNTGLFSLATVCYTADRMVAQKQDFIQLPGFKSYSLEFAYTGNYVDSKGNESAIIEAYRSEDVNSFTYSFNQGKLNETQINEAIEALKADSEATQVYDQKSNLSFKVTEDGNYTLVAVGYDADANAVCTASYVFEFKSVQKASEWKSVGFCNYTDGIIYSCGLQMGDQQVGGETWSVEVEEHMTEKGRYRLVHPYLTWPINIQAEGAFALEGEYFIEFNAQDPNRVYIVESEMGVELAGLDWGPLSLNSCAYLWMTNPDNPSNPDDLAAEGYFGKMVDGVITFPGNTLLLGRRNGREFGWFYSNFIPNAWDDPNFDPSKPHTEDGLTTIDMSEMNLSAAPAKTTGKKVANARVQQSGNNYYFGAKTTKATIVSSKDLMNYYKSNNVNTVRLR